MPALLQPDTAPGTPKAPPAASDPAQIPDAAQFAQLQHLLATQFRDVFPFAAAPRTVVVVPSLSMPADELAKISGVHHYEERLLCMLMLLRMPRTHLVYLTSQPIDPTVIDYYLHLLPGIPVSHARRRLKLLSCHDASPIPLTEKILRRPRLLERLRRLILPDRPAHMTCFNATGLERSLSLTLGLPLYAADPALLHLGSKSGSRHVFREAGVEMPLGFEDLRDENDLAEALALLKSRIPNLRRAVVKLNDGFSGEGNAVFDYASLRPGPDLAARIGHLLPSRLRYEAADEHWERYRATFGEMQGIVEAFIEGRDKRSPSAQCRINPAGQVRVISTHDQVLGGPSGQVFLGCTFPAAPPYRLAVQAAGLQVAEVLRRHGVLGRFGVDFVSIREGETWRHFAIEINLRKGGTTHPFLMLQYLTDGRYDTETGLYRTPDGLPRYYYASDNLQRDAYRGLVPDDLIDIAVCHGLHFHGATQQGVVFHLLGALSEFGKLGVVCIGDSPATAQAFFHNTVAVLDEETRRDRV